MSVFTLGLNHHTASVDWRERFALGPEQIPPHLRLIHQQLTELASRSGAHAETAILSTCNRTELYCAAPPALIEPAVEWFAQLGGVQGSDLAQHLYTCRDGDAARHAFRVASGLDSMVLGEPQILGQMKQAVRDADEAGTLGTTLHQLFQRSFAVAKEVRTATEIGEHSISMAAASVRLAAQLFEDLRDIQILFVGAGEMIELAALHFAARMPRRMTVANRTLERGEKLAYRVGAQAMRLSELPARLHEFDAVVSCTASTLPIIGLGAVERALKARKHKPMFMVDLAVPRDIEAEVGELDDVYLYTLDDLSAVVHQASEKRQAAVAQAEVIIEAGVQNFVNWLDQRASVPLIQALQHQTDAWREHEIARARKMISRGASVEAAMEALSKGLTHKLLHGALAELHNADPAQRAQLSQVMTRLFLRGTLAVSAPAARSPGTDGTDDRGDPPGDEP
jgi:glutamyl-tRNA reductase